MRYLGEEEELEPPTMSQTVKPKMESIIKQIWTVGDSEASGWLFLSVRGDVVFCGHLGVLADLLN